MQEKSWLRPWLWLPIIFVHLFLSKHKWTDAVLGYMSLDTYVLSSEKENLSDFVKIVVWVQIRVFKIVFSSSTEQVQFFTQQTDECGRRLDGNSGMGALWWPQTEVWGTLYLKIIPLIETRQSHASDLQAVCHVFSKYLKLDSSLNYRERCDNDLIIFWTVRYLHSVQLGVAAPKRGAGRSRELQGGSGHPCHTSPPRPCILHPRWPWVPSGGYDKVFK